MFFFGIITTILASIFFALVLWVLCAFSGRLVRKNFRMTILHHFIMCFAIVIPTVILLAIVFSCSKANNTVTQVETGVAGIMMVDEQFAGQLQEQAGQTSSAATAELLTNHLAQNFNEKILSEYPILGKFININSLLEKSDINRQLSGILQDVDLADVVKKQQLIQTAITGFTKNIRSKIKSVQRTALLAVILLQVVAFAVVFYRAGI